DRYAKELSELAGLPLAIGKALVADTGGEALALALRASGLGNEVVVRLLMTHAPEGGRDYHELKRLADLLEQVTPRAAMLLADQWRSGTASARPAHVSAS